MLKNLIRQVTAMTVFLAAIAAVWVAAWAKSVQADADRRYWPPSPLAHCCNIDYAETPSTQPTP